MISIYVHAGGRTKRVESVDPAWLDPDHGTILWVDLAGLTPEAGSLLSNVFRFHELAVEDALGEIHHPKIETYDGYLYLILHGIDFRAPQHRFLTDDIDFFLGGTYLVTVHKGNSRSVARIRELVERDPRILGEGAPALLHRIVDEMVDHYEPEVAKLEDGIEEMETAVFEDPGARVLRRILELKQDVASLRRVTLPQRDAVSRLARREFPVLTEQVSYRFRDVYDHLVRVADEALMLQDRVTSLLEAHLSNVSNQLNGVMKVLTVIATIFMPLTVLTGLYGMNVRLPRLPGGESLQFWGILVLMASVSAAMLWAFRRRGWI